MEKSILILIGLLLFVPVMHAQDDEYIVLKGKTLTMPNPVKKSYGTWTNVETKTKISPAELALRQKNTEVMKAALDFDKDPKLTLQKANIGLLKSKNASLGVTIYYYSYKEIPGYLNMSAREIHDLWISRLKPNPKSILKLSEDDSYDYAASKGEGTIEGKLVSYYMVSYYEQDGTNMVLIYTVSKQNANKNIMFFGETFGRDWDTGMMLDEGH